MLITKKELISLLHSLNFWGQKRTTLNKYAESLFEAKRHTTHIVAGWAFIFSLLSVPLLYIIKHDMLVCIKVIAFALFYVVPIFFTLKKYKGNSKILHFTLPIITIFLVISQCLTVALSNIQTAGFTIFCVVLVVLNMVFIQPFFFQIVMNSLAITIPIITIQNIPNNTTADINTMALVISAFIALAGGVFVQRTLVKYVISNSRISNTNKSIKAHSLATYREINKQVISTFSNFIDGKDSYTNGHSIRVAEYAYLLGKKLEYSSFDLDILYYSALLHDVGKITIPDAILNKPGLLTKEEYEIVKQHPIRGKEMLSTFTSIPGLTLGVEYHHERMDGNGYPHRLKGKKIPVNGRIIAVADTWDALTSDRIYRANLTMKQAIAIMQEAAGPQLDPAFVSIFLQDKTILSPQVCAESMNKERIKTITDLLTLQVEKEYSTILQDSQKE